MFLSANRWMTRVVLAHNVYHMFKDYDATTRYATPLEPWSADQSDNNTQAPEGIT